MQVLKSEYKNFKKFSHIEINFNSSVNVLVGKNNSGKSTVLDGILFALGRKDHFNILNKVAGNNANCYVKLIINLSKEKWAAILTLIHSIDIFDKFSENFVKIPITIKREKNYVDNKVTRDEIEIDIETSYLNFLITPKGTREILHDSDIISFSNNIKSLLKNNLGLLQIVYVSSDRKIPLAERFIPFNEFQSRSDNDQYIRHFVLLLKEKDPQKYNELIGKIKEILSVADINPSLDYFSGNIQMNIGEFDHSVDIGDMGSGISAILLLFSKVLLEKTPLVLLDEPDVHIHPGLSSELVRYFYEISNTAQIIFTAHNESTINSVKKEHIISLKTLPNVAEPSIVYLSEKENLFDLFDDLGVVSNVPLIKIAEGNTILMTEGESDWDLLKQYAKKCNRLYELNSKVRFIHSGGRKELNKIIVNNINKQIRFFYIRDRDEYDFNYISNIEEDSNKHIKFWSRREIENYLIDAEALRECLIEKIRMKGSSSFDISIDEVKAKIHDLSLEFKRKVILLRFLNNLQILRIVGYEEIENFIPSNLNKSNQDIVNSFSTNFLNKILNQSTSMSQVELLKKINSITDEVDRLWNDYDNIIIICPGKDLLKSIVDLFMLHYNVQINKYDIINKQANIHNDILHLLDELMGIN